jgi:hypothetical protein
MLAARVEPKNRTLGEDEKPGSDLRGIALASVSAWMHPDDVERVLTALEARLDPVNPNRCATEFRLRRGHGEVRWVETLGLAYFEGVGRERRTMNVVGTVADTPAL